MSELTKSEKKYLAKLVGMAYERALSKALEKLYADFSSWKEGQFNTFDLEQSIHEFHNRTARELYKFYNLGQPQTIVSRAIVDGILEESEVDEKYRILLAQSIEYFKKW